VRHRDSVCVIAFCSLLTWSVTACSTDTETPTVTVAELYAAAMSGRDIYVLDVRTQAEFHKVHLPFVDDLIPYTALEQNLGRLPQEKDAEMYMFCRSGHRSKIATDSLVSKGYTNVCNVEGGIIDWQKSSFEVATGPLQD
jgi:rhodanese-related sulfurtransferase